MKTKCYCQLILFLLVIFCFNAKAQEEPQVRLELKLTEKTTNTSHNYKLYGINYSLSNPFYLQDESELINNGSCSLMMELEQDADNFLMTWVGGSIKNVSGEISIIPIDGIKKPRKIIFTDGQVAASSESFYTTVNANSPVQLSIYVKTLAVDGTTIFTQPKPANQ